MRYYTLDKRSQCYTSIFPKNYIRSGAFSKSKRTVSPRDTGLIPKDRKNPLRDNLIIPT